MYYVTMGLALSLSEKNSQNQNASLLKQLPDTILLEIHNYLYQPHKMIIKKHLKKQGKELLNFYLVTKFPHNLSILKQQYQLLSKYSKYNKSYEWE